MGNKLSVNIIGKLFLGILVLFILSARTYSAQNRSRIVTKNDGDFGVLNGKGNEVLTGVWYYDGWGKQTRTVTNPKWEVSGGNLVYTCRGVWQKTSLTDFPIKYSLKEVLSDNNTSFNIFWKFESEGNGSAGFFMPLWSLPFNKYDNSPVFVWVKGRKQKIVLISGNKSYKQMGPVFNKTKFVLFTGEKITLKVHGMKACWQRADGSNFRIFLSFTRNWIDGKKVDCGFKLTISPAGSK
ncbi:MAG: hypothetical protein M1135_02300 [Candidatus Omnitrophica bacterium]|nr:hypothetical protein [Candidatus Omnitrophota bacterium]